MTREEMIDLALYWPASRKPYFTRQGARESRAFYYATRAYWRLNHTSRIAKEAFEDCCQKIESFTQQLRKIENDQLP